MLDKLGNYIKEIDIRNTDNKLGENNLYGLSITKEFITSHANIVGVKFNDYKIVNHHQFAYIPVTSRSGDRVAIAINKVGKPILISNTYTVFEIFDQRKLNSEYLMLLFSNPEFDRYAIRS